MSKVGVVIFPDGEKIAFGNLVCIDDKDYLKKEHKGHKKSFESDVLVDKKFEKYYYNENDDFLGKSVPSLSMQGLIILLNSKDYSNEADKVIGFVPEEPTPMQLVALENYLSANMFIEPDNVLFELLDNQFCEYYSDEDFIKYDGLEDYCNKKKSIKVH